MMASTMSDGLIGQVHPLALRLVLLSHLLLLHTSWTLATIKTANHIGCPTLLFEEILIGLQRLFCQ